MMTSPSTELAAARVRVALLRLALIEAKAGYRADQPRTPAGNHEFSGRWSGGAGAGGGGSPQSEARTTASARAAPLAPKPDMITTAREKIVGAVNNAADQIDATIHRVETGIAEAAAEGWEHVPEPLRAAVDDAVATAAPPVADFLVKNREPIARTLGGLQALGGFAQIAGGGSIAVGGVATGPDELAAGALGTWMVAHGIDDFRVGVTTLVTGHSTPSALFLGFKALGLNDNAAAMSDLGLSTLGPGALAKMSEKQLAQMAEPYLLRDSLEIMLLPPVKVVPIGSLWAEPSPALRGDFFEIFDAKRLGLDRLPPGFPGSDIFDRVRGVAISDKTLDFRALRYAKEPFGRMGSRLNAMVDSVADFNGGNRSGEKILANEIRERRLHLAIPAGRVEPGQALLLRNMRAYAKRRGVKVRIFRAR